jgi:FkbM family methyltransferase
MFLQAFLQRNGRCVTRYPIANYLARFGIDCVLDVGANSGQTGQELRKFGFRGQICSFEPQKAAFLQLKACAESDSKWSTFHYGLGDCETQLSLNISGMGPSSSFLPLSDQAVEALPALQYVGAEVASIHRLDSVFPDVCGEFRRIFLKIDTQGYEKNVVLGAERILDKIVGIQLELSLTPQYENEPPAEEVIRWVRSLGFVPFWIIHGYSNPKTLQLYQVDIIFIRETEVLACKEQDRTTPR